MALGSAVTYLIGAFWFWPLLRRRLRTSVADSSIDTSVQIVLALLMSAVSATTSPAQTTPPPRSATLVGTVRDSTGRAMIKSRVCTVLPAGPSAFQQRCARPDSLGAYRLDSLPPHRIRVAVSCEAIRGLGKWIADDSAGFADSVLSRRDWVVSTAGCDMRPVRRVTGTFRGHYTPGFESSEFIPCAADAWFIPGDSLSVDPFAGRAWATWSNDGWKAIKWPDVPRDSDGYSRYYVRWRGTVVGPGNYGHMGASAFEFVVDSLFEVRRPRRRDCR